MFDNRTPSEIKVYSVYVPELIVTKASGGITRETLSGQAKTGVDFISL